MVPMVTADGYLHPCCQVGHDYKRTIKTKHGKPTNNPFYDDAFHLYKHSYADIVEGSAWNDMIEGLKHTDLHACNLFCGNKDYPRNSVTGTEESWTDNRVYTKDLDIIQFETTNRCTLECPYCARQAFKRRYPDKFSSTLNKKDLDIKIVEDVLSYRKWKIIVDCGTYGDPIYYKHYHEMVEFLSVVNPWQYTVSIAATGKTQQWWDQTHEAWEFLHKSGTNVTIMWGIDGLSDTSSKHRIKQDWDEISTQMKRAAKNGLYSTWQYIPMSFNEHQIEQAMELANDWGVIFFLKPSDRFLKDDDPNRPSEDLYYHINDSNGIRTQTNKPRKEQHEPRVHIQR